MVRGFQRATMALKYADVPVIVAPAGLALGGGCEMCLHGDRVVGRGRDLHGAGRSRRRTDPGRRRDEGDAGPRDGRRARAGDDPLPHVQRVFETIGFGKVSTSADDARRLGYLRTVDAVVDEPRSPDRRSEARGARAGRRLRPPPAAGGNPGRRRDACRRRSSSASTSPGGPDGSAITTRSSDARWRRVLSGGTLAHLGAVSETAAARSRAGGVPAACAASGRRRSASPTRSRPASR